jgi:hypothetical protein
MNYDTRELPKEANAQKRRDLQLTKPEKNKCRVLTGSSNNKVTNTSSVNEAGFAQVSSFFNHHSDSGTCSQLSQPLATTTKPGGVTNSQENYNDTHTKLNSNTILNGRKRKQLNLNTYKFHAMGDYVESI